MCKCCGKGCGCCRCCCCMCYYSCCCCCLKNCCCGCCPCIKFYKNLKDKEDAEKAAADLDAKGIEAAIAEKEEGGIITDVSDVENVAMPDVVQQKEAELQHEKELEEGKGEESAEDKRKRLLQGYSTLHSVAGSGNVEVLENAIDSGDFDIESTKEGHTPLIIAAKDGQLKTVEMLIKKKANLEATHKPAKKGEKESEDTGHTPLHFACFNKQVNTAKALIEAKANFEAQANKGTPIIWATSQAAHDVMMLLVAAKADLNATIEKGKEGDPEGADAWTPLLMATKQGDQKAVDILARGKANLEAKLKDGSSALSLACVLGHMDVAKSLLDQGADPESPLEGMSLLLRAAHAGQLDVMKTLVGAKANVNFATPEGLTAMHIATQEKNKEAISTLVELGANMEATDEDGCTPLMLSVLHDLGEPCELLLEKKADTTKTFKGKDTLVHVAASQGFEDMTDMLTKGGCSVNGINERGQTPLLLVVATIEKRADFFTNKRLVKSLCDAKADTKVTCGGRSAVGVLKASTSV